MKKKFDWDKKLAKIMQNNQFFSTELQEFVLNLMKNIEKNIDNKESTNSAMLYSVINLLKHMPELQKYENSIKKQPVSKNKFPTPEEIEEIERIFLGIK